MNTASSIAEHLSSILPDLEIHQTEIEIEQRDPCCAVAECSEMGFALDFYGKNLELTSGSAIAAIDSLTSNEHQAAGVSIEYLHSMTLRDPASSAPIGVRAHFAFEAEVLETQAA